MTSKPGTPPEEKTYLDSDEIARILDGKGEKKTGQFLPVGHSLLTLTMLSALFHTDLVCGCWCGARPCCYGGGCGISEADEERPDD